MIEAGGLESQWGYRDGGLQRKSVNGGKVQAKRGAIYATPWTKGVREKEIVDQMDRIRRFVCSKQAKCRAMSYKRAAT